jgi:hypothetical protein
LSVLFLFLLGLQAAAIKGLTMQLPAQAQALFAESKCFLLPKKKQPS